MQSPASGASQHDFSAALGTYPPAQASHQAVAADRQLFMRTLRQLHDQLGTQFRIPMVSGRELDIHLLYKQVTALGGLEAVMANKKWTEVSQPFQFPPSFTSKSFTLRKMYSRLLHDYEQVYFHRSRGQPTPPPGVDGGKVEGGAAMTSSNPVYKRRRLDISPPQPPAPQLPRQPPALSAFGVTPAPPQPSTLLGIPLTGTVDSQFDAGYFVTIHAGTQEFKGVLYMPPPQLFTVASASYGVPTPTLAREQQPLAPAPLPRFAHPGLGAITRRGRSARRDPLEPKQNKTPFNFFSIDARARAKAEHPTADQKEISKIVGDMWQKALPDQKAPYIEQARIDKERYQQALSEYQQRLTLSEAGMEESQEEPFATFQPQGQESGTPEPEGPSTVGRSRYRTSPTLRALPPLHIAPPEAASPDASFSEGAVSPREQEAAQQMQALHQGVGAYTGFGREGALLGQPQGGPSLLSPAYGVPIGFPQQELEAEREEYEDDGSEADDA
ncbi:g5721 [Coccomyxa viridis]|uniref:G5721 protein n=1 Tax=Coccomyxa viridis TaxID=1274662 RepID=A0ABP1FUW0_9CHLO